MNRPNAIWAAETKHDSDERAALEGGRGVVTGTVTEQRWPTIVAGMSMTAEDQELVRAFRRQAQDARKAVAALDGTSGGLRMADGYIEIEQWLERYRLLCVPVRRTFLEHDKASFRRSAAILCGNPDDAVRLRAIGASETYEETMTELAQEVVFGGRRIRRLTIVKRWLDAAVFHDSTAQRKPYEEMLATLGRAIEGMAAEHTEELARAVLALDEAAALALDEPLVRPDPVPVAAYKPKGLVARLKAQFGLPRKR